MTSARKIKARYVASLQGLPLELVAMSRKMSNHWYILKGRKPVAVPFWRQMQWMQRATRTPHRPTLTIMRSRAGDYIVSTIFLGMDHAFMSPIPVLFETMAFLRPGRPGEGKFRDEQYRYRTWEEAVKGHRQLVTRLATMRRVK